MFTRPDILNRSRNRDSDLPPDNLDNEKGQRFAGLRGNGSYTLPWSPIIRDFLQAACVETDEIPLQEHQVYIDFLKARLLPVLEHLRHLLPALQDRQVISLDQGFAVLASIAKQAAGNPNFDIDGAIRAACQDGPLTPEVITNPKLMDSARALFFYLIGCMSMLYSPSPPTSMKHLRLLEGHSPATRTSLPVSACRHTLPVLIQNFGQLMPTKSTSAFTASSMQESPDAYFSRHSLYVSLLNVSTLQTLGNLRIVWVDNISSHLHLDDEHLTLKVFRLPSFCQLFGLPSHTVLSSILDGYYDDYAKPERFTTVAYLIEIRRSYSLLFGIERDSRLVYKSKERRKAHIVDCELAERATGSQVIEAEGLKERNAKSVAPNIDLKELIGYKVDPLLDSLCRSGEHSTRNSFSKATDFPILAERLTVLQDYILRQNATSLRMLWRDRRNKMQWSTFWAVIFIGGFGIFLQILQVGVALTQLVYQVKDHYHAAATA